MSVKTVYRHVIQTTPLQPEIVLGYIYECGVSVCVCVQVTLSCNPFVQFGGDYMNVTHPGCTSLNASFEHLTRQKSRINKSPR